MDAPPPIPPRPPGYETLIPVASSASASGSASGGRPPLPPRGNSGQQQSQSQQSQQYQQRQQQQQQYSPGAGAAQPPPPRQQQPPYSPGTGASQPRQQQQQQQSQRAWNHLFYSDGTATPLFGDFMAAFFAKLDPQQKGYLTPEVFSGWLDVCGVKTEHNVWKNFLRPIAMFQPVDQADYEFKAALEAFRFDHHVVERNPGRAQIPFGGMPLLTLRGFTEYMAVETAEDPDDFWPRLGAAQRAHGVWLEMGSVPRWALLARKPPELQARIEAAHARSREAAAEKLEAMRVKSAIEARGRRAALELIGDYRYEYRPY